MAIPEKQMQRQMGQDSAIAQALGDPVRIAILRALDSASRPLGLKALSAKTEHKTTAIAPHLPPLIDMGAIVRTTDLGASYTFSQTPLARTLRAMLGATTPEVTASYMVSATLEAILNRMASGVAFFDISGELIRLNSAGVRIIGRGVLPSESISTRLMNYDLRRTDGTPMPVEDSPSARALRGETVSMIECLINGQHGPNTWLQCNAEPLRDRQGAIYGAVSIFEDITEQRLLSREEARQRELAAAMIEHTFSAMAIFDASDVFRCIQHNENFMQMIRPISKDRDSIVGMSLADLFQGETLVRIRDIYERVRATGEPYHIDEFSALIPLDPHRHWYRWRLTPLRDEQGKVNGLLNVVFEITELVNARDASRRHAKELSAIIEALPEAVLLSDNTGRFTLSNSAAERTLGKPIPTDVEVNRYSEVFHTVAPDGRPLEARDLPLVRALQGETVVGEELIYERPDHHRIDLLISSAPVDFDDSGQIGGAVAVFQDITGIKELERQRDDFLGIAAHELRTPLATILVTLQAFLRRLQNPSSSHALSAEALLSGMDRMYRQAQRLNKLISDLLDTTRIRTGALIYDLEPCDFVAVVKDAVAGQIAANPSRNITLSVPNRPVMVMGDAFRLSQVVDNLVANALKFSQDDQPVTLSLKIAGGMAHLRVTDKGVGIPSENIELIFDRFYRAPGVDVQSGAGVGLGLGLHITHSVIERHNGHIEVRSTLGSGSTFEVSLPLIDDSAPQES